jgi:peptide chain release factor 1
MAALPHDKLDALEKHFSSVEAALSSGPSAEEYVRLSKEYAELEPIVRPILSYQKLLADLESAEDLLKSGDREMAAMAEAEIEELGPRIERMEQEIRLLLLPKDAADEKSVILEVRGGTGGDEAALFAGDLLRMYQRYAELKGWKFTLMEESPGEVGGYKEVVASISGKGVYARLKFEGGVHRVQRVPVTESQGRIHTSAAGVFVMPEAEDVDVEIHDADLRIDVFRSSGPGGQSVNTTDSAVRITHVPTGIVVSCQNEKSQLQNKDQAMRILRARLLDAAQATADAETADARKSQVRTVDRSERVRTYNFPENRISDHRTGFKAYNLDQVMDGALDDVIASLVDADLTERLAGIESS